MCIRDRDCWDSTNSQSENGYYLKGLLYLSLVLLLALNFNKRLHTTSKWLIFSALTVNVVGSYLNLGESANMVFLGYSFYGVANILFTLFMYRLVRHEELSSKEPYIVGTIVFIGAVILLVKSKVDFAGFTYFVYAYGFVLSLMLVYSLQLYSVKNKKSTALNCFIPASVLFCASGIILLILRLSGENSGVSILKVTEILCSGYAVALMTNGAKKVLK